MTPPVIAVIGPVEPGLLTAWTSHYRGIGVERFLIAFHFPEQVHPRHRDTLLGTAADLGIGPALTSTGPWHEHTNTELRERLRTLAGPGWHLLADADEFHQFPGGVDDAIAAADTGGRPVVGGLLFDRITCDGALPPITVGIDPDQVFPLGGHLTHRLLGGDPRKIVAVRSDVVVASGNHRAPGYRPDPDRLVCVHHFKWRRGVLADLRQRVTRFGSGEWIEHTPAVRSEAARLIDHVGRHHGRLDPTDPRPAYRPATLAQLSENWVVQARNILVEWRPPTPTSKE
ncbi:hypothetical protein A5780_30325 [Nocardia sp. 852002-20019_SCH5090214]|uniref:hypothetical protein n=1 Tax=Nocardia TaxID=1817 RepID=UPI0007A48DE4|nr:MULTISPECIES: hypothetical protein [Nocardia]MCC3316696.1 hypothetical protein [Nocardia africana]OBA50907.1 hypothetical protein A5780_30325 [Nocardia sp. 852002-20019_SCH5090214]